MAKDSFWTGIFGVDKPKDQPTKAHGVPGIRTIGGWLESKEKDARLAGQQKYVTYNELLSNTSIAAAGVRYFLNLVSNATWKVTPADDTPAAHEVAEFVESVMYDMDTTWTRVVRKSGMYRFYGFGLQEWTAKRLDNGMMGMKDVAVRPQNTIERWDQGEKGEIFGIIQRAPITGEEIYIPRNRLIHIVDDTLLDSPEGLGLLRNIVDASNRLRRFEKLEAFGFEGDLRGIPMARIPYAELQALVNAGSMSQEQANTMISTMEGFLAAHIKANPNISLAMDSSPYRSQTDTGENPANIPMWDFKLLEGNSRGQVEVAAAIDRINMEIARVLGVEHLLLGNGDGSHALSRDKSHNFAMIVDSTLTDIKEAFNADYVRQICRLNGIDKELWPEISPSKMKWRDAGDLAASLRDMATAGHVLTPNDPAINEWREIAGLSPQPEGLADMEDAALIGGEGEDDESMEGDVE